MCIKLTDSRIDKKSLDIKLKKIGQFKTKIEKNKKKEEEYNESIKDIKSELMCGEILLKIEDMSDLKFSETPDIIISLNMNTHYGFEVKRIRTKPEDLEDDKRIQANFGLYGKPRTDSNDKEILWSKYVTDLILEKMNKKYSTDKTILFIDSHSFLQIESHEIKEGIYDAIKLKNGEITFEAIMYKTQFVSIDNIDKTDIIFLNSKNSIIFNSIKKTNNFIINYVI